MIISYEILDQLEQNCHILMLLQHNQPLKNHEDLAEVR